MERAKIHQILETYWGHKEFRPLQEEIIINAINKKDALALLPTGGGKSICFQVPAMAMDGICIVISPLIALMKDQIENLKKRSITAEAIYTGISKEEIELYLNAAVYGRLKFLYLSPERLQNEVFLGHLKQMNVCLIAVDEAHCISQWGYDFRPPYLQIAKIREILPEVPVLALTATATKDVVFDIQDKLNIFPYKIFQQSFKRENLTYYVVDDEDKFGRLIRIIRKVGGTGVVYVRNRQKTQDIAEFLNKSGVKTTFYHAGLDMSLRNRCQKAWIDGKIQVIVATNAFGMGIDKSNVRFVVHMDMPDSLEAYFQEAGRGGRDGKRAFALLLFHKSDIKLAYEKLEKAYPPIAFIANVYEALYNYYKLPIGMGKDCVYEIDIRELCRTYNLPVLETHNSIRFLEKEGYIQLSDETFPSSKLMFRVDNDILYKFKVDNPQYEELLQVLVRIHGGRLFSSYASIYEKDIAKALNVSVDYVSNTLNTLDTLEIISYLPLKKGLHINFLLSRMNIGKDFLSPETYILRYRNAKNKLEGVIKYASSANSCRSRLLLSYFNEADSENCKRCDMCLSLQRSVLSKAEYCEMLEKIKPLLQSNAYSIRDLSTIFPEFAAEKLSLFWQDLMDNSLLKQEGGPLTFKWKE